MTTHVLILCTHNSARSVLSEGMLNHLAAQLGKDVKAHSAGSAPSGRLNPFAIEALNRAGIESVLDDRDQRPGVKFKDADLIGFPWRVVVGARGLAEGKVELKHRRAAESVLVAPADVVNFLREKIAEEIATERT